jgi:glycosyltransferase
MKISIITVTFNSAATIRDTLVSIANQEYPNKEIIVIDGNSSDQTLQIVSEFDSLNIKILSEPDGGLYDAMNKGIHLASGDIIGILNSDDFYTHSKVLNSVAAVFENTDVDACYANLNYVEATNTSRIIRKWRSGVYSKNKFIYGWMPPHPTFFIRKSHYLNYGGFNLTFKRSADYELMLRMLYKHNLKAVYVDDVIVHMRTGGASNSSLTARREANKEDALAWKINGLQNRWYTTWLKPISKISQYF